MKFLTSHKTPQNVVNNPFLPTAYHIVAEKIKKNYEAL